MNDILKIIKKRGKTKKVFLSDLKNFFKDRKKAKDILIKKNPLIYWVNFIEEGQISYAITFINSGKIGKENYMTKGHFHEKNVSEVYYLLNGSGEILLRKGSKRKKIIMKKNIFHYIPTGYAHRTINTGKNRMSFLSIYQKDSGHNYKKIEKEGF